MTILTLIINLMNKAVFVFNEDTRQWEYENIILYEIKGGWRMWRDKIQKDFESIYDVLNYLHIDFNLHVLFRLPPSVEDTPSNCA